MAKLDRSELLKFVELTSLKLSEKEIDKLRDELDDLLNYTNELLNVAPGATSPVNTNTNILREDVVKQESIPSLLSCGPDIDEPYFVVPKIVDDSKEPA